jgi:hypothetical protein
VVCRQGLPQRPTPLLASSVRQHVLIDGADERVSDEVAATHATPFCLMLDRCAQLAFESNAKYLACPRWSVSYYVQLPHRLPYWHLNTPLR